MNHVLSILEELASTLSRNEKESILQTYLPKNDLLQRVCKLTYDKRYNYYIKDLDFNFDVYQELTNPTLDQALDFLEFELHKRTVTGDKAKLHVYAFLKQLTEKDSEVLKRVLSRDLRCGASAKTINKVIKNLIYIHPYQRCSTFSEKNLKNISFPCYSQLKMDGLYLDIIVKDGEVTAQTRSGQYVNHYVSDELRNILLDIVNIDLEDYVFSGEMLAYDESGENVLDRKTSNGYLNGDEVDSNKLLFVVWNAIEYNNFIKGEDDESYCDVINNLKSSLDGINNKYIKLVDTVVCNNKNDVMEHFRVCRERGEEGTVIKDFYGKWKDGTSKHQIKCKVIFDCDLKIIGYKLGQGKYEHKLGSILCSSMDDKLQVSIGGGFTDEEREEYLEYLDDWIKEEKIVTVRGNDVIINKEDDSKYSIFLPRFVEIRNDKTEADDLERITEQVKSFTNALDLIK